MMQIFFPILVQGHCNLFNVKMIYLRSFQVQGLTGKKRLVNLIPSKKVSHVLFMKYLVYNYTTQHLEFTNVL